MEALLEHITNYLNILDWAYILTFILLSYCMNHCRVTAFLANGLGIKVRTRYRVLITGMIYGIVIFFIRGYDLSKVECLFQSFVFAMVFHKLLVETLVERFFPKKSVKTPKDDLL